MSPQYSTGGRAVSVGDDTVVKIQEPGASRRERLRTQSGRGVGQRTGLFVVPAIVSFDDARGEIVFERLHMTGLKQLLSDGSRGVELVEQAARALAAIHGHLEPSDRTRGAQSDGAGGGPERGSVPLHGDFGLRNLFYLPDSDRIAIIDWSNADWIRTDADVGAPEIDVAVFLISLFHRRLFGPLPVSRRHEVASRFLTMYASASPYGLNLEDLKRIVAAETPSFQQLTRRRKGSLHALGCRHAMIDLRFFLHRLSHPG